MGNGASGTQSGESISRALDNTDPTVAATCSRERVEDFPTIEIGQRVGRYVVLEHVGQGGMGVVYAAYDPELDRKIALKVLLPLRATPGSSRSESDRLTSEARALAKLSHPNVVTVHDVGYLDSDGAVRRLYIAMEFVSGMDLGRWLAALREDPQWRKGRRWRDVLKCFREAAQGLAAAHAAGVVHRDFKPGNVLVGTGPPTSPSDAAEQIERVRVVDFGLARAPTLDDVPDDSALDDDVGPDATALVGTPAYMAPEQLAGDPATEASDQYAFCCTLFEALTGQRPHPERNLPALAAAKLGTAVRWPTDAPSTPRWLQAAVLRGLAREPSRRHGSMDALLHELERDPGQRLRRFAIGGLVLALLVTAAWLTVLLTRPGVVSVTLLDDNEEPVVPSSVLVAGEPVTIEGNVLTAELPAGMHDLVIEADGYETAREPLRITAGSEHDLIVLMHHEKGLVNLEVHPPGATVRVDGLDRGSRLANLALDTGHREVEISKVGHVTQQRTWNVTEGSPIHDFVYLPRSLMWKAVAPDRNQELEWAGDVNGDGRSEVLQRNFATLILHDPVANSVLWRNPIGSHLETGRIFIRDLDGDGLPEHFTQSQAGPTSTVFVAPMNAEDGTPVPLWSRQGEVRRAASVELAPSTRPGAFDAYFVDPDSAQVQRRDARTGKLDWSHSPAGGLVDIVAHPGRVYLVHCDQIVALDERGRPLWRSELDVCPQGAEELLAYLRRGNTVERWYDVCTSLDVNEDDVPDVVCPAEHDGQRYVAVSGADGRRLWSSEPLPMVLLPNPPRQDLDGDGVPDWLVPLRSGGPRVAMVSLASGAIAWKAPGSHMGVLVEDDGSTVVAIGLESSELRLLAPATGEVLASFELPARLTSPPRSTDFDADGRRDIIVLDDTPALRALDFDGEQRLEIPLDSLTKDLKEPMDQDGDGFTDLLADSHGAMILRGPNLLWERHARDPIRSGLLVEDLDHDGDLEVVLTANFDRKEALHVLDARTGRTLSSSSEPVRTIREIVRLDRSPAPDEVLLTSFDGTNAVLILSSAAQIVHRSRSKRADYGAPGVGDVDGDGNDEIVSVPWDPGPVTVLSSRDLEPVTTWQTDIGSWVAPQVVDVDADGDAEVLGGYHDGSMRLHDPATGKTIWTRPLGWEKQSWPATVVDFDGDGQLEVVTMSLGDVISAVALSATTGEIEHTFENYGHPDSPVVVADVDGDGAQDLFAAHQHGLCRLTTEGRRVWCYRPADSAVGGPAVVFDLDSDLEPELLIPLRGGSLHVLDARTGTRRWMFNAPLTGRVEQPPVPADVDGDGLHEVFVANHDGSLRCLRSPPTRRVTQDQQLPSHP